MKDEAFFTFKNNKYTLFNIIIFLRFSLYLLQFSTHKNLIYTKMLQMLSAIRRIWPFGSSCSRTRVTASEASPLFFLSPLINWINTQFWSTSRGTFNKNNLAPIAYTFVGVSFNWIVTFSLPWGVTINWNMSSNWNQRVSNFSKLSNQFKQFYLVSGGSCTS